MFGYISVNNENIALQKKFKITQKQFVYVFQINFILKMTYFSFLFAKYIHFAEQVLDFRLGFVFQFPITVLFSFKLEKYL